MSRKNTWQRWCCAILLWLATVPVLAVGVAELYQDVRSYWWPTAEGVVTEGARLQKFRLRRSDMWELQVRYRYTVAGETHTSNRIHRNNPHEDRYYLEGRAHSAAADLPAGKRVKVFYSPEKPSYGILEPGVQPLSAFIFLMAVVLGLLALAFSLPKRAG